MLEFSAIQTTLICSRLCFGKLDILNFRKRYVLSGRPTHFVPVFSVAHGFACSTWGWIIRVAAEKHYKSSTVLSDVPLSGVYGLEACSPKQCENIRLEVVHPDAFLSIIIGPNYRSNNFSQHILIWISRCFGGEKSRPKQHVGPIVV